MDIRYPKTSESAQFLILELKNNNLKNHKFFHNNFRVCLCTEGFGNRMCTLENVSDKDIPPDIAMCMLYIDNALSMRALQEMMSADSDHVSFFLIKK